MRLLFLLPVFLVLQGAAQTLEPVSPLPVRDTLSVENPGEDTTIFSVCEVSAQFPGGDAALMSYLRNTIVFPANARDSVYSYATIFVGFVVEKNGTISSIRLLKPKEPDVMTAVVLEAIRKMPVWEPGKIANRPVRCSFTLPVRIHYR